MRKSDAKPAFTSVLRRAYTPLATARHAARVRRALVLPFLAVLLFAASASAATRAVDRGVVIRVRPAMITLQELDGSRVRIRVSRSTTVVLDGRSARLRELRRGDVAFVVHFGRRPALSIRAFSR